MFTYKLNFENYQIEGPICHNYSTAWFLAQNEIKQMISDNWQADDNTWKNIKKPLKINLKNKNQCCNLIICKIK